MLGSSKYIVLTNIYPSYDNLYRNAFVHSRIKAYAERGIRMEVFCFKEDAQLQYREFENVDVVTGGSDELESLLSAGHIKGVCVHFLNEHMWRVLEQYVQGTAIHVWIHGFEIQPWYRRKFLKQSRKERAVAKSQSRRRMLFWRKLFGDMPENLGLVFVSRHLANGVMDDVGIHLSEHQYSILHNPIDTALFEYFEKPTEQRKRILSIRPYTSETVR